MKKAATRKHPIAASIKKSYRLDVNAPAVTTATFARAKAAIAKKMRFPVFFIVDPIPRPTM